MRQLRTLLAFETSMTFPTTILNNAAPERQGFAMEAGRVRGIR